MRYDLAIFDLDGTLADSFPFFVEAQNVLAARHGFRVLGAHELEAARALTPRELMRHVGLPGWKLPFLARSFMRLMRDRAEAVPLFDGVDDALAGLEARGVQLAVVTSNSLENARRVLGASNAARMRCFECGASIHGKRQRLAKVLRTTGVSPRRAIYVGDQVPDGEVARAAGMDFGAVAWGYATAASLQRCAPARVFERPADLVTLAD